MTQKTDFISFALIKLMVVCLLMVMSSSAMSEAAGITDCQGCRIKDVKFTGYHSIPYFGDLWPSTVGPDGRIYLAFGDGSGLSNCLPVEGLDFWPPESRDDLPKMTVFEAYGEANEDYCGVQDCARNKSYPPCPYTRTGVIAMGGRLPDLTQCSGVDECLLSRHLPSGRETDGRDVKPSSLSFVGEWLVMHLHEPSARPTHGFLVVSDDRGRSWEELSGSPWGQDSPFRVLSFLQDQREDRGWLYGYGIRNEIDVDNMHLQKVYLARVPLDEVADYTAWRYFAGVDKRGKPRWSRAIESASPLKGLATMIQGSALYHRGIGRYLFFSGFSGFAERSRLGLAGDGLAEAGSLFEAPTPWGPWGRVARFPGGFIGAMIPADDLKPQVWYTAAGNTVSYNLHIGRLKFVLNK